VVISNHLKPPELVITGMAAALRDRGRAVASFSEIIDEFERRFGDIEENLNRLDYVSADSAYLLQPQSDGTYQPVIHNIRFGQLVTALERGHLPLAHSVYMAALETANKKRMNSGERGEQAESHVLEEPKKRKPRPFKCEQCGTSVTTQRKLNGHIDKKHGGS
jgi:hypothetical protein